MIHSMMALPPPDWFARDLLSDPVGLSAQDEYLRARASWERVAPTDGRDPQRGSPLQFLLYARMTTSKFVFEMTARRTAAEAARG